MAVNLSLDFENGGRIGLKKVIVNELSKFVKRYARFVKEEPTTQLWEEMFTHSGFDIAVELGENESVIPTKPLAGFKKIIKPVMFNLTYEVSDLKEKTEQYKEIKSKIKWMMIALNHAIEREYTNAAFNNGFSTSLTADGLSVYNDAHPQIGSGTTFSNVLNAVGLTPASIQNMYRVLLGTENEWGQPMMFEGDVLLIGSPQQRFKAREVLQSQKQAYTAENQINALEEVVWYDTPYITGVNSLFMVHPDHHIYGITNGSVDQSMVWDDTRHVNRYQVWRYLRGAVVEPRGLVGVPNS